MQWELKYQPNILFGAFIKLHYEKNCFKGREEAMKVENRMIQ